MRTMFLAACLLVILPASHAAEPIPGVGPIGEIEKLSTGHKFLEGPAWDGQGSLYFTDIPREQILRITPDGNEEAFTEQSRHANGLMFSPKGKLLACEMDGQLVEWDIATKSRRVLADSYEGKRFNACNDLVIDTTGGIYFTDPHYSAPQPLPQGEQCVYYRAVSGQVSRVTPGLPSPNGILLSIDEKTLYVLPSESGSMRAYDVVPPGKLNAGREFCHVAGHGGSDGAALDTNGNLYLTTALGVQVFSPQGKHLGTIELPEHPANCTFGGPDRKTLYVTARTSLYAVPMEAVGHVFGKK